MLKALDVPLPPRPLAVAPEPWLTRLEQAIRIRARKLRQPRIITVAGVRMEVDRERLPPDVVRALYKERYEDREAALVRNMIEPGDRVLEMGAGIGFITLLCAKRCGAENVLSYEANPHNEPLIRRNFELNGLRPQLRIRAVSVTSDERELFVDPNILSTGFINRGRGATAMVKCDAIADVIDEFQPNCLVLDVEGAEIDLLPAAPLDGVNKIILETHARIVGEEATRNLDLNLQSRGFTRYELRRNDKAWLCLRQ